MLGSLPVLDGSIPAAAQLVGDEALLASQIAVGLYDNGLKSPSHQSGSVHVTSHRLLYLDDAVPAHSFALPLAAVAQSEHYNGFLTSSAKIELVLHPASDNGNGNGGGDDEAWVCAICAHENPRSLGQRRTQCSLCGAVRPTKPSTTASTADAQCAVCTFINAAGATRCEMCDTPLKPAAPTPTSSAAQPAIKLSFRKGGDRVFYAALKRALQAKAWKTPEGRAPPAEQGAGIHGIMNAVENSTNASTDSVASALRDLEALSAQAKTMVAHASALSAKLHASASSSSSSPLATPPGEDASSYIQRSLYNMGLALPDGPAMQDDDRDRRWMDDLAAEVAGLLRDGLMGGRGMVGLDEIWCAWNRARGVALLTPDTFLSALTRAVADRQLGLALRTLKSGLIVLHVPRLSHAAFCARLAQEPAPAPIAADAEAEPVEPQWHTPLDVAAREGIAVALAAQLLHAAEDDGVLWRDVEPFGGVRWSKNVLRDWTWDGD